MDPQTHPTTYKPKSLVSWITCIAMLVIGFLAGLGVSYFSNNSKILNIPTNPSLTPTIKPTTPPDQVMLVGVIRTSGLSFDLRSRLKYTLDYQITDFGNGSTYQYAHYFIASTTPNPETYLGKCVSVNGELINDLESTIFLNPNETLIEITQINQVNFDRCAAYDHLNQATPIAQPTTTKIFTGTIARVDRVAPDISYDYQIVLDQPYLNENNASGLPLTQTNLDILPQSNQIWETLETNINKKVRVVGEFNWGYAESQYFLIREISTTN